MCEECSFSDAECITCGLRIGSLFDSDNSDPEIDIENESHNGSDNNENINNNHNT